MKILAINGSNRGKHGYTQFLIDKVFEGARANGAECETIVLSECHINRCTGCFTCQKKERLYKCIFDDIDDTNIIYDKMRLADIIIFATPVYVFHMSSLLKNLLDRYLSTSDCSDIDISKKGMFFHSIDHALCSKPFATIICQDNLENETHKNIITYFKTYSKFMDANYVGSLVRKSGQLAGHGETNDGMIRFPQLVEIYKAYVKAGEELVKNGRIHHITEKKSNQSLIKISPIVKIMAKSKAFRGKIIRKAKKLSLGM